MRVMKVAIISNAGNAFFLQCRQLLSNMNYQRKHFIVKMFKNLMCVYLHYVYIDITLAYCLFVRFCRLDLTLLLTHKVIQCN